MLKKTIILITLMLLVNAPKTHSADNPLFRKPLKSVVFSPDRVTINFSDGYTYDLKLHDPRLSALEDSKVPLDKMMLVSQIVGVFESHMPRSENLIFGVQINCQTGKCKVFATRDRNANMSILEFDKKKHWSDYQKDVEGRITDEQDDETTQKAVKFAIGAHWFDYPMSSTWLAWMSARHRAGLLAQNTQTARSKRPKP